MLRLEKVNGKNVWDILKLKVSEPQRNFVAPNDVSIIEAYTANGYAFPFGLYDSEKPVGFVETGVVGGIYDDRFLVKPTKSAVTMMWKCGHGTSIRRGKGNATRG